MNYLPLTIAGTAALLLAGCERTTSTRPDSSPAPTAPAAPAVQAAATPAEKPAAAAEKPVADKPAATEATHKQFTPLMETKEELRKRLTAEQWAVTQEDATERPWTNEFDKHFEEGIYVSIVSGKPLFSSKDKFDSGCGWPAFAKPISDEEMKYNTDYKIGYARTEVRGPDDAHLGHVFDDGPKDRGGKRFCINSASLRFIAKDKMAEAGYGHLLSIFDAKPAAPAQP